MGGPRTVWKAFAQQLRHPKGGLGSLLGHAMAIANRRPNELAVHALKVRPSDVVLELGFGPGKAIQSLASRVSCGRVLGIDQSEAMLAQASRRNRVAIRSGRVDLRRGTFEALPWRTESIDKVLAVNVIYFFRQDAGEIREAKRVLRWGGTMAIYATDRIAMDRWKAVEPETHQTFSGNDLVAFLRMGGFEREEISLVPITVAGCIPGLLAIANKGLAPNVDGSNSSAHPIRGHDPSEV